MTRLSTLSAMIFCLSGLGAELPVYLGDLKGVFMPSVTVREVFELQAGKPGDCQRTEGSTIIFHHCPKLQGARATIRSAHGTITVNFHSLYAEFYSLENGDVQRQFYLTGKWEDRSSGVLLSSTARLILRNRRSAPDDIRGSFSFEDYGLSGAVHTAP